MLQRKSKFKKFQVDASEKDLNVYGVKVGKNGKSSVYVERKEDLYALIQSYKDQCGLECMLALVKRGQLSADSLADDGQHSGDGTIPTELGPAYEAIMEKTSEAGSLAHALGLTEEDLASEDLQDKVKAAIVRIVEEQKKEAPKDGEQ